jgi:hypothetical protein
VRDFLLGQNRSLGPDSIQSNVKNTSFDFKVQKFTPIPRLANPPFLPDYRTAEYAEIVNKYSFGVIPPAELAQQMLSISQAKAKDSIPPDLAMTLFLWARAGYISLPATAEISDSEVQSIDTALATIIFSDENAFRTFFAGANGEKFSQNENTVISRGYARFSVAGNVRVRVIFRELLPKE